VGRQVILYELNEVPWEIIDRYVSERPRSALAGVLSLAHCLTSVNSDPVDLQPWRTWPTFHTSLYTEDHNSMDLGQDPSTFRGDAIWDVVDRAGLRPGLFGPLQTWPAHPFSSGGFYVPDTFSRTADAIPKSLERFQAFNLEMTRDNAFASTAQFDNRQLLATARDLVTKGLRPGSALEVAIHLFNEKRDPRHRASRSIMQAVTSFDLYWRLHKRYRPDLSVFFTNHVAGMMHRYWGDYVPEYAKENDYCRDEVFASFVLKAMDTFDAHLSRILRFLARRQDSILVVASSMGQAQIPYDHIAETYVVDDAARLAVALGLTAAQPGLAMYPRVSFAFPTEGAACKAAEPLTSVRNGTQQLMQDVRVTGRSVSFEIRPQFGKTHLETEVQYAPLGSTVVSASLQDLGLAVRPRLGGGNTAHHIREGILIAYGDCVAYDPSRARFDVLDAAPSILTFLGIKPPQSMQGKPGLFNVRTE
jgi:hypothetical protein